MNAELNACMRKLLGACMRILGACMRKRLGAKYAVVGCKVCGSCGVQSVRLLGASIWKRLGACMRLLGAKYADVGRIYAETFGCMYFGCKSMEWLGACLTVGSLA